MLTGEVILLSCGKSNKFYTNLKIKREHIRKEGVKYEKFLCICMNKKRHNHLTLNIKDIKNI